MKIAYILLTNGLEFDDRIRKEMMSIRGLVNNVEFKVFAFHGDNHAESGVLSYGVPYEIVSLKYRGGSKSLISMLRKEWDFYSQISKKVKDYDLLWVCDDQPFFFPMLSMKPVIWDLHEIPASIIGTRLKNFFFHIIEKRCKWLIHANMERLNYLIQQGVVNRPFKNLILRNYPDKDWIREGNKTSTSFSSFQQWLDGHEYIYLQGINSSARFPLETLSAVMEVKQIKAVVLGNVSKEIKNRIAAKYPDADKYLYYVGQVVQSETAAFIANSKFSIIFYDLKTPNNQYCEPNRMFQCLGMGKPVLVGCNEPMRNIVSKYGVGVILNSEGSNLQDNINGIKSMLDGFNEYSNKARRYKDSFAWESQKTVFQHLFEQ